MVPAAIYSVTLAVAARQLEDAGCPCLTSAPSGTSYPTFTLAGKTITYDNPPGELRVIPKPQMFLPDPAASIPVPVIVSWPSHLKAHLPLHRLRSLRMLSPRLGQAAVLQSWGRVAIVVR